MKKQSAAEHLKAANKLARYASKLPQSTRYKIKIEKLVRSHRKAALRLIKKGR